jgi:hypothetical protein
MRCAGPHWEGDEPKPMMNEREKSVPVVVAVKSMNEAGQPAEEWMEPRAGAKGNAGQQSTLRTQRRGRVSHALGRIRQAVYARFAVKYPRVGAVCGKAARTGSVRGAHSNMRPYRDLYLIRFQLTVAIRSITESLCSGATSATLVAPPCTSSSSIASARRHATAHSASEADSMSALTGHACPPQNRVADLFYQSWNFSTDRGKFYRFRERATRLI